MESVRNSGAKAWIMLEEFLHLLSISRKDKHNFADSILDLRKEEVKDGFATELIKSALSFERNSWDTAMTEI
jgi:hypothetical protein